VREAASAAASATAAAAVRTVVYVTSVGGNSD